MDRVGPGGIPRTQVPQAIDQVVLRQHIFAHGSDGRAQSVWGLKATSTITAGASVHTE